MLTDDALAALIAVAALLVVAGVLALDRRRRARALARHASETTPNRRINHKETP